MTTTTTPTMPCPVCHHPLSVSLARGRQSGKLFLMLKCPINGRHFRGFITDQEFVAGVLSKLPTRPDQPEGGHGP